MLVVHMDSEHSEEWMSRLSPLIGNRAVTLNYSHQDRWDRGSLPVQLFELFGPHPIPESFREHYLPAVVLFRGLRRPEKFTFGEGSKDREEKLERLRATLELDHSRNQ